MHGEVESTDLCFQGSPSPFDPNYSCMTSTFRCTSLLQFSVLDMKRSRSTSLKSLRRLKRLTGASNPRSARKPCSKVSRLHLSRYFPSTDHKLSGIARGDFHITGEFLGHLFRSTGRGVSPYNNVFLDSIYGLIGVVSAFYCASSISCSQVHIRRLAFLSGDVP